LQTFLQCCPLYPHCGRGFKSHFLVKSEICGIFCWIAQKLCFLTAPSYTYVHSYVGFYEQNVMYRRAKSKML
jgi:hypothetical protein